MLLRLDAKKSYERQFFIKLEKPYLWSILGPFGLKNSERHFFQIVQFYHTVG